MSEPKWLSLFQSFITQLRIDSKESQAIDSRGSELILWDSQKAFLEQVAMGMDADARTFICLKARQMGVSTVSLAVDVFWLATHPGISGALVTDTESNRNFFRSVIRRYIESIPKSFLGKTFTILKDNKDMMTFSNGARLDFLVAGSRKATWGEGRGYTFAHLTEVANYGNPEGLNSFRETLSETSPDRLFIYESTAKGFNHYRDLWIEAGRDIHSKRQIFIGWYMKPMNSISKKDKRFATYGSYPPDSDERELIQLVATKYGYQVSMEQLAWYRWRASDESTTDSATRQNLPWTEDQAFVMSGYSFFQTRVIQGDLGRVLDTPILFKGYRYWLGNDFFSGKLEQITDADRIDEVELRVWEEPDTEGHYVIGVDPAYGRNDWKDRHCVSVWRCYADKLVQVAEYADNNVETRQCAWVLAHLAGAYKNCIINIELTGGAGRAVLTELENIRNQLPAEMYATRVAELGWEDFLSTARWYMYNKPDSFSPGFAKGFMTSHDSKVEIMNQLRDSYTTKVMEVNSAPMLEEMLVVVQDGSTIEAPGRSKDDRVFAAALANRTWIDPISGVRSGLIAQGLTYERVQAEARGDYGPVQRTVDRIVAAYFKRVDEAEPLMTPEEKFLYDRGLS